MNQRYQSRQLDLSSASFQIPYDVNATANDLLLDDDGLEHDFFNGVDYTLSTPVPSRTSSASYSNQLLGQLQSPQLPQSEHGDFFSQQHGERVFDSDLQLTPTPRARRHAHDPGRLDAPPLAPTPKSTPLLREDIVSHGTTTRDDCRAIAEHDLLRSLSSLSTPKASTFWQAPLSPRPVRDLSPSASRPDPGQLRSITYDFEPGNKHHKHAAEHHPGISGANVPAPGHERARDPRSPEVTHFARPASARARRQTLLSRKQTRSRKQSSSPPPLPRTADNAVILSMEEGVADLQDRDEGSSIPKHKPRPDPAVLRGNADAVTKEEVTGKDKKKGKEKVTESVASSTISGVGKMMSKATLTLKPKSKRNGGSLQSVTKKRKTVVERDHSGPKPPGDEGSRESAVYPNSAISASVSASAALSEVSTKDKDADADLNDATLSTKAACPGDVLPPSSPPPLRELTTAYPINNPDTGPVQPGLSEGTDEVQDFLSRYAKKYGQGTDIVLHPTLPKVHEVGSAGDSKHTVPAPAPKRSEAPPESNAPKGKHARVVIKESAAKADTKGESKAKDADAKKFTRRPPIADKDIHRKTERATTSTTRALPDTASSSSARLILPASQMTEAISAGDQMIVNTELPVCSTSGGAASRDTSTSTSNRGECELAEAPALPPVIIELTSGPSASVPPEASAASSEPAPAPAPPKLKPKPTFQSEKGKQKQVAVPREARPTAPLSTTRPLAVAATKPLGKRKAASVEPRADDMFERKKRDNYLQKGLDLSAHSSRRFLQKPEGTSSDAAVSNKQTARQAVSNSRATEVTVPAASASDCNLDSDKKNQKASALVPPDLGCDDRVTNSQSLNIRGKPSGKPTSRSRGNADQGPESGMPTSDLGRTHIPSQSDKDLDLEDPANTSSNSIGNVIAERLVHYSQRIMGSIGLLSSRTNASRPSSETTGAISAHLPEPERLHQFSPDHRGHDHQQDTSDLRLSELSPNKVRQLSPKIARDGTLFDSNTIGQFARVRHHDATELDDVEDESSPSGHGRCAPVDAADPSSHSLQASRKRPAGSGEAIDAVGEIDFELHPKRTRLTSGGAAAAARDTASSSQADKASGMSSSSRTRAARVTNGGRGLLAKSKTKATTAAVRRAAITRNTEASGSGKGLRGPSNTEKCEEVQNSCSLTVPMAPMFTGDVLRQQRALKNAERQREVREKDEQSKGQLPKLHGAVGAAASSMRPRAPLSNNNANPPVPKPMISHVLRFETGARLTRQEFEEKFKTWEKRAGSSAGSETNGNSTSRKPIPDFKTLHAAHRADLADMAARRRKLIAPTVPVTPHFSMDTRVVEREKFDEARRAREKEIERMMEEKRRVREEEEERKWLEARKRTIPRANAVPEWYASAPKKS